MKLTLYYLLGTTTIGTMYEAHSCQLKVTTERYSLSHYYTRTELCSLKFSLDNKKIFNKTIILHI